jgi:hypothetical protein
VLLAGVLTMVASAPIIPAMGALPTSSSPTAPPSRNLQSAPGRLVHVHGLAASPAGTHPHAPSPFLPKDRSSYAAAHKLANQGTTGRRSGVAAVPRGRLQVAAGSAPQTQQQLAGFPVMDLARQVALYGSDQSLEPPDTQLAAGPTSLAEADNSALSFWTKSGSFIGSADLNTFFAVPSGYSFSDPRILYDAESGRWFLSGLAFNAANDSQVDVAVSVNSDPTGAWNAYLVGGGPGVLPDQPMIGVSSDKVVISWNDFSGSSPATATFSGEETLVLQKSAMLSGVGVNYVGFGPDLARYRVVPAQSLTPTSSEWLSYNTGLPTIGVVEITGTPLTTVAWTEHDPAIQATTMPPGPRQPSGVAVTQDIDDRFLSATWQSGMLWVAGTDGCIPAGDSITRSCMKLVAISTGGAVPTVVHDFDAGQSGVDLYYPAATLDGSGNLFIGYSASSPTMYPSALAVDSLAASPSTLENPITLASGKTSYLLGGINRWGDYSAAAPDPSNPADVWLTAEYQASASNPGDWGTATGRLAIQPSITTISPNSGSVSGGLPVTIAGSNFQPGAAVSFGSHPASSVVIVSSTQITAITPAGTAAGPVDVGVNQPDGTAVTASSAYTYTPLTTVSSVVPNSGPLAGGTSVVITGTNFSSATAVAFGAAAATTYTIDSTTQITATSPAGTGTVDVTVTASTGTSATSAGDRFTYGIGPPISVGATAGDQSASVTWTAPSFDGGSSITSYAVTGSPGGSQILNCPCTTLQATVGSLTNGTSYTFTVHATNGSGSGPESTSSNAVIPAGLPGAPITVTATAGDGHATVSWTTPSANGSPIMGYTVSWSGGSQPCAGSPCTVTGLSNGTSYTFTVTATNSVGTGPNSPASNAVTPVIGTCTNTSPLPTITSVSNNEGPLAGGTTVTITGSSFCNVPSSVLFGSTHAAHVTFVSDTTLVAVSPAHASGVLDVRVTAPSGTSAITPVDKFTFTAAKYCATFENLIRAPRTWIRGQAQTFTVTVSNCGTAIWPATGSSRIDLNLHFTTRRGGSVTKGYWLTRTTGAISRTLGTNRSTIVTITLTPTFFSSGVWLESVMRREGYYWFDQATSRPTQWSAVFVAVAS